MYAGNADDACKTNRTPAGYATGTGLRQHELWGVLDQAIIVDYYTHEVDLFADSAFVYNT